jgi:iron complex outermembrane receptor protein
MPVYAQKTDDDVELEFEFDAIVVEEQSDGIEYADDVNTALHSGFVETITREEFGSSIQTVAELVSKETALQIRQSGGLGSFSQASLRGSGSEQVIIYLDGMPLNGGDTFGVDLGDLELSDIESIEVYRGSAPIHFSQASLGGVINIKRLRQKKESRSGVTLGSGSFSSKKVSAYTTNQIRSFDYLISMAYSESQNDFEYVNDKATRFDDGDDEVENRNNAQFSQQSALLKLGQQLNTSWRSDFSHQYQTKKQGLPSWNNSEATRTYLQKSRHHSQFRMAGNNLGSIKADMLLRFDYRTNEDIYDDTQGHIGRSNEHLKHNTVMQTASYMLELPIKDHLLLTNITVNHEYITPNNLRTNTAGDESQRQGVWFGFQDNWRVTDYLSLTPGVRHYSLIDDFYVADEVFVDPAVKTTIKHEYTAPQFGVKLWVGDRWQVKANWAKYFREPKFNELFGVQGFFLSNSELEAETGTNYDLGFSWQEADFSSRIASLSFEGAYFVSDISNVIVRRFDSGGVGKTVNISSAMIQGVELQGRVQSVDKLAAHASVTLMDARNHSKEDPESYNKKLPGRYAIKMSFKLEKQLNPFKFYAEYLLEEGAYYDMPNILLSPDKKLLDAGLSWKQKKGMGLSFDVNNVLDEYHEDFYRYPMPGRSVFVSMSYEL